MTDPLPCVEGYFDATSYEPGDHVVLRCGATIARRSGRVASAAAPLAFDVEVARIGATRDVVHRAEGLVAEPQPVPTDAYATGAGWPETADFVAGPWRSGWYEAVLRCVRDDGSTDERRAGFVLRAPTGAPTSPMLLQLATNTWNAYNDWGRNNLYLGGTHVSFLRPTSEGFLARPDALVNRNANIADEPDVDGALWAAYTKQHNISPWSACAGWATWEGPFVAWAESKGYRFDYAANTDLEVRPQVLDDRRLVLSVGHDEYWSSGMRDAVEAFIAGGGNVAFFSGNTSFWQVRFEDDGATMVSYKDRARREDPLRESHPELLTSSWSDPVIGRSEARMTGVSFSRGGYARHAGCTPRGQRGYSIWRPEHWIFEGTDLRYGDLLGADHCVVGYECDGVELTMENGLPTAAYTDHTPSTFQVLGTAPTRHYSVDPARGINEYPAGLASMRTVGELQGLAYMLYGDMSEENQAKVAHGHAVLGSYTNDAGATVVTSGSTDWAYGLAGGDPLVERITANIIDRLST